MQTSGGNYANYKQKDAAAQDVRGTAGLQTVLYGHPHTTPAFVTVRCDAVEKSFGSSDTTAGKMK